MEYFNDDIRNACETLANGGLILYPTDTIWGIGCDATNDKAVERVFALKQRADSKAMLALVDTPARMECYVRQMPDIAWDLVELADKPLTIIYPNGINLAPNLIGDDCSIGIRVTKEEFSKKLCERFRRPVVSTSANISGQPSPARFSEIPDVIRNGVDYIVNYRRDDNRSCAPSSIIQLGVDGSIKIIRR